jgi:hypothetical protein
MVTCILPFPIKYYCTGTHGASIFVTGVIIVNDITATYLRARADAVHKTPSELVEEMVQERMSAAT